MNQALRYGRYTSSVIGDLQTKDKPGTGFGAPALTLIKQKGMERRLQRTLSNETNAKETSWGKIAEVSVFDKLGLDYKLCSQETIVHSDYPFWAGSPDMERFIPEKTVCDIKCPFTLNSFCTLIDAWDKGGIAQVRKDHKEGNTYYWQIVSNAILTNSTHGELIVYVPYLEDLPLIRQYAIDAPPEEQHQYRWLEWAFDNQLPYLIKGAHYKDLNIMRFEIPQADKDSLTERVLAAEQMLSPTPHTIIAHSADGCTIVEKLNQ